MEDLGRGVMSISAKVEPYETRVRRKNGVSFDEYLQHTISTLRAENAALKGSNGRMKADLALRKACPSVGWGQS